MELILVEGAIAVGIAPHPFAFLRLVWRPATFLLHVTLGEEPGGDGNLSLFRRKPIDLQVLPVHVVHEQESFSFIRRTHAPADQICSRGSSGYLKRFTV